MKIASKKGDASAVSSNVTGKDKAKLLKMMKEKQRNDENVNIKVQKPKEVAVIKSNSLPTTAAASKLPENFFDSEPTTKAPAVQQAVKTPVVKFVAPVTVASVKTNTSQMPVGFFDNPTEELSARGVNIVQHKAEQQKIVDTEFQSFLSEINVLKEEGEEEVLEEVGHEAAGREYEEQAVQMAYMTKLAVLYQQSEAVVDKQNRPKKPIDGSSSVDPSASSDFNELIALSSSGGNGTGPAGGALSSSGSAALEGVPSVSAIREDVESVLYRKLQTESLRKRRLQQQHALLSQQTKRPRNTEGDTTRSENATNRDEVEEEGSADESGDGSSSGSEEEDEEYSPLDFMDWTSKGV
jgi:hypothetical protein